MNHHSKENRFEERCELPLFPNDHSDAKLILLYGRRYKRNLSLQRICNHRQIANEFHRLAEQMQKPDVIFCALPTLELAREAVRYGKRHSVPVVVDIRDQWPDFMVELCPAPLRPLAKLGLGFMYKDLKEACRGAVGITGNAPALVRWGVSHSGRETHDNDQYFAHGYPEISYDESLMTQAKTFWQDLGVGSDNHLPVICFIGSVRYTVMDFETVISAFKPISSKAQLVIAGSGDDLPKFKSQAVGIEKIVYSGWVDGPAVKTLMQLSDMGLAPYRNSDNFRDSMPNKLVEYLSEGLPLISSLEGFSRQLMQEHNCASFYSEGSPTSLTTAMTNLIDDDQTRELMGDRAYRLYKDSYSAYELYGHLSDYLEAIAHKGV